MKCIYRMVSREGLGLILLASLYSPAHAENINRSETETDLPDQPDALYIGNDGTGSLTISHGKTVLSGQDPKQFSGSVMGYNRGDTGTLTVDGGHWDDSVSSDNVPTTHGTTAVGGGGTGTLNIQNGGKANTLFINVGQNEKSTGVVNVDGKDSELQVSADATSGITIGNDGNGTLNITHGGSVRSNSSSYVGNSAVASGTVNVSGNGSNWTIATGSLAVGRNGKGELNINAGGVVNSQGGGIATEKGGSGIATVNGPGSTWNIGVDHMLSVGYDADDIDAAGTLVVANQGSIVAGKWIEVGGDDSTVNVGAQEGSPAAAPGSLNTPKVKLNKSSSSLIFNHTDTSGNYLFSSEINGSGAVKNLSGTTVLTGENTYRGGTTISGGTLQLGDGATAGSIVGNVLNNSTLVINNPSATPLSGVISGNGDLTQNGAGTTQLTNSNTYTGTTTLTDGALRTDVENSIARSHALNIHGGQFDLNGHNQQVNRLGGTGGEVRLNGATLTVNNETSADNTTFSGDIVDGTGAGELNKDGSGTLTLSGKTGWTGNTQLNGGELVLDGAHGGAQLISNIIGHNDTALTLRHGASLTGSIDPTDVTIDSASRWNMTTDSAVDDVNLAGTITFAAPDSIPMSNGHTLTVNNWNGQGGTVVMNTVLGDDTSATDRIVVNGNTQGNTQVKVNNAGGHGAQTVEGIRLVEVNGQSDGDFTKSGRIVAGSYDYNLVKKGSDWFLTSLVNNPPVTHPDDGDDKPGDDDNKPGDSGNKPDDGGNKPADDGDKPHDNQHTLRPESASYTANLAAANTLFITRLHDRLGETQYTDMLTGEKKVTSLWLRQVGGHNRWKDNSGQLSTQSHRYVIQMGGDVAQWSSDGLQRWHLGVMAGYGNDQSNSHSSASRYHSRGSVNGYSAGLYATWYQNDETRQGTYLDSWAQYSWFNNTVKGQDIQSEAYKSRGATASLELGYTHKLGEFSGSKGSLNEWYIQPQAQAIWMGVTADDHRESNGTRVSAQGEDNLLTRLGVRTYLKGHSNQDNGKDRTFQPFVEMNWIHNTQSFGTRMDDVSVYQAGTRNIGEVKTGIEGQLSPRLSLWGNVGVQIGDKGYSDTAAMLGGKYSF